ncbi:Rieske 2Fe-2S domain-containing protein [Candidatus Marinimicrobia bacterium]|jgi:cytochrome b6-f complex iron-sulfur subunit|nr:Rieske 2Fe-2S domain-containing protein [Candidatus Neomarinimicrobiota bacterium]|tara:strand:- start:128 stop:808 length:681 start_codon:yes stop_codon:yes gene_type:complete
MNLTQEEKNKLISAKDESQWYKIIEDIKSVRNNLYPNDLAREILAIYHNKFPVNNYPVFEDSKQSKIDRKSFLTTLSVAWVAFAAATGGFLTVLIRFLFPNVLFEPPQSFKIGFPEDFEPGRVDLRFKKEYNVWIVRDDEKITALSTVCTHLGCTPNWQETERKFKCPCHGSGFRATGINFEGPAPRPLERFKIALANDGQIMVDKTKMFKYEKGEWNREESFLKV